MGERIATLSLPSDHQVLIDVTYSAPARSIYHAYTKPDLIKQWWGRPGGELVTCDIDLRAGGTWRYVFQPTAGPVLRFHGTYTEVVDGERIAYSDVLENLGGIEATNIVTFCEHGGRTVLSILATHTNKDNRDAQLETFDEGAMQEPFNLLEDVARRFPSDS